MNLKELTISQQLKSVPEHPRKLMAVLQQHGWTPLGTGIEATVAWHPRKEYVLKIFPDHSKYRYFVEFVQKNQSNPHLPKFSRYVKPVPGTDYLYVRMEKLSQLSENELIDDYLPYLLFMIQLGNHSGIETLTGIVKDEVVLKLEQWGFSLEDLGDIGSGDSIYQKAGGFPLESWEKIIDALASNSQSLGIQYWDMHGDNFMQRDGTLVIADPYW